MTYRSRLSVTVLTLALIAVLPGKMVTPTVFAQASTTTPIPDELRPARDMTTFSDDLRLTNRCIEAGESQQSCLCLTQVLKYELNLRDYRAASRLYSHPASMDSSRSVARLGLSAQGMAENDIREIDYAVRGLMSEPDFDLRCQEARRYFAASIEP